MEASEPTSVQKSDEALQRFELLRDKFFFADKSYKILLISCSIVSIVNASLPFLWQIGRSKHDALSTIFGLASAFLLLVSSPAYVFFGASLKFDKLRLDLRKWPCLKGFIFLIAAHALILCINDMQWLMQGDSLALALFQALFCGLLFPFAGALSFVVGNKIFRSYDVQPPKSGVKAFFAKCKEGIRQHDVEVWPYYSLYTGFVTFCVLLCCLPYGLGPSIYSWLGASLNDARIGVLSSAKDSFDLQTGLSVLVSIVLIRTFSAPVIRLCACYQLFLKEWFALPIGDSLFSAVDRTLSVTSHKVPIRSQHPHLRSAWETIQYIFVWYALLFFLVAFLPRFPGNIEPNINGIEFLYPLANLGKAISNWIFAAMRDAHLSYVNYDTNMRLFTASIVAGYGVVPVAVMACTFLPARRPTEIFVSTQGILGPQMAGRKLQFWSELKRVRADNISTKNESITLEFGFWKKIRLFSSDFDAEKLAEILALADEQGTKCSFDLNAIKLRNLLGKSAGSCSLAEAKKFESTIFAPHVPGDQINQGLYRVVRKLYSKPLSAVYLVKMNGGRLAVLKQFVIPSNNERAERMKKAFDRECEMLRTLDHPNIAKIIDTFQEGGAHYVALEHIKGTDLRELVRKRGPRKEKIVIAWAIEVCQQLKYLHSRVPPIIHRDLSPDNLMLDENGRIRIIDFGAALQFMEGVTGTLIGKQAYIAPEQLRGNPTTGSDIYGFGATLYYLLSGEDPKALQQSNLERPDLNISPALIDLVRRCTEFDESARPASVEEILNLLQGLTGRKQVTPKPATVQSLPLADVPVADVPVAEAPVAEAPVAEVPVTISIAEQEKQIIIQSSAVHDQKDLGA